jgi:ribosomal 50S subunit-recycling heat shock protein
MRLDKFLKVSRLVKRRTLAKELCDGGRASVNGRPAKAGLDVEPGDLLELHFGPRVVKVQVVETREHAPAGEAQSLYRVV